jgi:hypothetical protein
MYSVAIAWLYVLLLISIMQPTVFRGIVTFVGAGLLPLGLLLYLLGTPRRRRDLAARVEATEATEAPKRRKRRRAIGTAQSAGSIQMRLAVAGGAITPVRK